MGEKTDFKSIAAGQIQKFFPEFLNIISFKNFINFLVGRIN